MQYVELEGNLTECFVKVIHVQDTSSQCRMRFFLFRTGQIYFSIFNLRKQGYDRANNMHGEFSGLKSLILRLNPNAHYIHRFALKLQLALVLCSKKL